VTYRPSSTLQKQYELYKKIGWYYGLA
jgi:hypothetical protein